MVAVLLCTVTLIIASLACVGAVSPSGTICQPRESCDFGIIPGYWRDNEWPQWQVVDACCRLEDLVGRSLTSPATFSNDEGWKTSVLIFGDSVERITLHDLCKLHFLSCHCLPYNLQESPFSTSTCLKSCRYGCVSHNLQQIILYTSSTCCSHPVSSSLMV